MRLKVFNIILGCVFSFAVNGQYVISGKVVSADSAEIENATVFISSKNSTNTGIDGGFILNNIPPGRFNLEVRHPAFQVFKKNLNIINDIQLKIILIPRKSNLDEVVISQKQASSNNNRMRGVESMGIYEGKKSEVIVLSQVTANLATNNARQIYSRVAGLNIFENDGAGLQLSIGGRGLDPDRTTNFNVRQNGYDISADALGYPESYYTPPLEAVERIQIVRGAASLQYGTQFGGLVNFVMNRGEEQKKISVVARQTIGSFAFYNAFTSIGGKIGKVRYYSFFQYKKGDGWRPNSKFENHTAYGNVHYQVTDKTSLGIDFTHTEYLAQQAGGLTDDMFRKDPRQSNRQRNWFQVQWNMAALHLDHKPNESSEFNLRVFGLNAGRNSVGFRQNKVAVTDNNEERDLIKGEFQNWGSELRFLHKYSISEKTGVLLVGSRYYHGFNHSVQGLGTNGKEANFNFVNPDKFITYDYRFPNRNVAVFVENIFNLSSKLSITPGVRYEFIKTRAEGYYGNISRDLAGNIINSQTINEKRFDERDFLLGGVGISFKPIAKFDIYSNISQNYRSITFSDMRISNPSAIIDSELKDEKGYSADIGIRSSQSSAFSFDLSGFYLNYNNRIGEVQTFDTLNRIYRLRTNVGNAVIWGIESYSETDLIKLLKNSPSRCSIVGFLNLALIKSVYQKSKIIAVQGNEVEFVPQTNIKTGIRVVASKIKFSFQYTYLSSQFSDATNTKESGASSVVGTIPAYGIMDASASYQIKNFKIEASINNLTDGKYFTRRATGYPGPGIIPSDGRSIFLTLEYKF